MAKPNKKKKSNENNQLISAALALIVLALLFMYLDEKQAKAPSSVGSVVGKAQPRKQDEYSLINREMQLTEGRMELNSLAREIENSEFSTPVQNILNEMQTLPKIYNPFETEDTAARVYKDLDSRTSQTDAPYLPEDRINALIEKQLWLNHYDRQQKEEFIKAVISNARIAGFDIQVNADYQVTNVRRMPNSIEGKKRPPSGAR